MRDAGALPLRHLPDRLACAGFDLAAMEDEFDGRRFGLDLANRITLLQSVGWVEPPGPAFGRLDDKLHETHHTTMMGFALLNPSYAYFRYHPPSGFLSSSGKYFSTLTS